MSSPPPSSVASRFVSQTELEQAKATREEQWRAAYARLGQEPPPQRAEDVGDGRSLYERLQTNKAAKEEQWQEQHKLSKQFRALEEDEILFLRQAAAARDAEEAARKRAERQEVEGFREAVAQRYVAPPPPIPGTSSSSGLGTSKPAATAAAKKSTLSRPMAGGKKDQKTLLKGIVLRKPVKEKAGGGGGPPKPAAPGAALPTDTQERAGERTEGKDDKEGRTGKRPAESAAGEAAGDVHDEGDGEPPGAKRRKVS